MVVVRIKTHAVLSPSVAESSEVKTNPNNRSVSRKFTDAAAFLHGTVVAVFKDEATTHVNLVHGNLGTEVYLRRGCPAWQTSSSNCYLGHSRDLKTFQETSRPWLVFVP